MLLQALMMVVQLLGIVAALTICSSKRKKKKETDNKVVNSTIKSTNKSASDKGIGGPTRFNPGGSDSWPGSDPDKREKKSEKSKSVLSILRGEEMAGYEEFKKVPELSAAEAAKRKHLLEQQREQRMANGELTRDVDDTLDLVDSMRVEKSEDRTPAPNLKDVDWHAGHPDRAKNVQRYEQRKRYDEWNEKPHFLHRRYVRPMSVVVSMQEYQMGLVANSGELHAGKKGQLMKAWCTNWLREECLEFPARKHPDCPYKHGDEPNGCSDEQHSQATASVQFPWRGDSPCDDVIVMDK